MELTKDHPLVRRVRENLESAADNDYDLSRWSDCDIAEDMIECTGEFTDCSLDELTQAVAVARKLPHGM